MSMRDRAVYLGRSMSRQYIYAEINIEPSDGRIVQFTDHSEGPAPDCVGIMFVAVSRMPRERPVLADIPDSYWSGGGQIPPEDRIIEHPASRWTRIIEEAWLSSHDNDMHAECDHMTEEMLNPSDEVLDEYIARKREERGEWREKYSPAFYGRDDAVQRWRLDTVVCPVTGYRWGRAWLAKTVDPNLIELLRLAHDNGPLRPVAVGR